MIGNFIAQFGGVIGVLTAVIVGGIAIFGVFNKKNKELKKEEGDTAKSVIDLLKEQVDALETKVDKQEDQISELTETVEKLRKENKTLTDVLQGRDDKTQQFYKDMYVAMNLMKTIAGSSADNSKALTQLIATLDGFMKAKA